MTVEITLWKKPLFSLSLTFHVKNFPAKPDPQTPRVEGNYWPLQAVWIDKKIKYINVNWSFYFFNWTQNLASQMLTFKGSAQNEMNFKYRAIILQNGYFLRWLNHFPFY